MNDMENEITIKKGRPYGYLSTKELAIKLFVSESAIRQWAARGKIKGIKLMGRDWFPEDTDYPPERRRGRKAGHYGAGNIENNEDNLALLIGQRLRQAMDIRGMSQYRLAELIDGESSAISSYIKGKNGMSVFRLIKICKALDISMDWICGLKEEGELDGLETVQMVDSGR